MLVGGREKRQEGEPTRGRKGTRCPGAKPGPKVTRAESFCSPHGATTAAGTWGHVPLSPGRVLCPGFGGNVQTALCVGSHPSETWGPRPGPRWLPRTWRGTQGQSSLRSLPSWTFELMPTPGTAPRLRSCWLPRPPSRESERLIWLEIPKFFEFPPSSKTESREVTTSSLGLQAPWLEASKPPPRPPSDARPVPWLCFHGCPWSLDG